MFSTPLICSSIGVTTVAATTSALAPGYWPVTLMIGGAISGYCAIGRRENDTPPRITKTIDDHGGEDRPVDEEVRNAHSGCAQPR